jgi:hypothetical protein
MDEITPVHFFLRFDLLCSFAPRSRLLSPSTGGGPSSAPDGGGPAPSAMDQAAGECAMDPASAPRPSGGSGLGLVSYGSEGQRMAARAGEGAGIQQRLHQHLHDRRQAQVWRALGARAHRAHEGLHPGVHQRYSSSCFSSHLIPLMLL